MSGFPLASSTRTTPANELPDAFWLHRWLLNHRVFGKLIAEGHAAKLLNLRSTLLTLAGGDAMPSAAISKLLSMKTGQGYAEFAVSSFGTDGVLAERGSLEFTWVEYLLGSRATTIYGGTSEVQLNIIAERLLGLPRDP